MMNFYTYNGVEHKDEQLYSLENQIKDQLAKVKPDTDKAQEETVQPAPGAKGSDGKTNEAVTTEPETK